jgi:hypothetical protein
MNKERLLNVAKAQRESKHPEHFTMHRYVNKCGTPACAFGHYAAREDLQDDFSINTEEDPHRHFDEGVHDRHSGEPIMYDADSVSEHFEAPYEELVQFFEYDGCGGAKTASEAAEFIERFVFENP